LTETVIDRRGRHFHKYEQMLQNCVHINRITEDILVSIEMGSV